MRCKISAAAKLFLDLAILSCSRLALPRRSHFTCEPGTAIKRHGQHSKLNCAPSFYTIARVNRASFEYPRRPRRLEWLFSKCATVLFRNIQYLQTSSLARSAGDSSSFLFILSPRGRAKRGCRPVRSYARSYSPVFGFAV